MSLLISIGGVTEVKGQEYIGEAAEPDRCEIVADPVVTLGDPSDPVAISPLSNLTRMPDGRYLVANLFDPGVVAVYSPEGRFLRTFGRAGQGPGEFGEVVAIQAGPGDSVFVWSETSLSVFEGERWGLGRTARLPVRPRAVELRADGSMLITAAHNTPELIGVPVHLLDPHGEIEGSFGHDESEPVGPFSPMGFYRAIARSGEDRVWSARIDAYALESWDIRGALQRRLEREVAWFPPDQDFLDTEAGWQRPPRSNLTGVREDESGRLWVVMNVPGANWTARSRPQGRSEFEMSRASRAFDLERRQTDLDRMVEVIDLEAPAVVGSRRFDEVYGFGWLPPPYAFRHRERQDGYIELEVIRLECLSS